MLEARLISHGVVYDVRVDNQGCMEIGKVGSLNESTKHIYVKFYMIHLNIKDGTNILQYVPSSAMAAEIFKNVLRREEHIANYLILGMNCA